MDSPLAQIQQRAEAHFSALARTRDTSRYPIFALEHSLSKTELVEVRSMLRSAASESTLSSRYWLIWVIYATELGYDYQGSEYWLSFEDETPGWQYHDRAKIKAWFRKFQKTYGGVTPRGPWAEHFNIIAWPITHAILPRYLQRQFAKLLYDLRFSLAFVDSLDEHRIGRRLAVHARGAPSRFRAFLEQEELTGQIVAALLGAGAAEGDIIHNRTLERVISDVEAVQNAREWLNETQRVVADRFKGIGRGTGPAKRRHDDGSPTPAGPRLAIQPDLWLRHAGKDRWSVFLEIKSWRPVATLSATLHAFLNGTRCRLNGAPDFKPAGWLLSGDRKGALPSWPDPRQPLILFDRDHPTIDHLLQSECRLHADPPWLFRLGADGNARHLASSVVRPGSDYIVVTTMPTPRTLEGTSECDLHCKGVNAYRLSVPPSVSAEMTGRLRMEGLVVARTIHVWPAGLPGRGWDGEGSSEWLTTESPCFGIAYDHPIEALSFRLNDEPESLIRADSSQDSLFVRLPPLPAGVHTMTVEATRSPELEGVAATPPPKGFLRLAVREPEPWTPGVTSHHGLIVRAEPEHADLDTLWRNELSLSVNGPEGFAATFIVALQSDDGREILSEQIGAIDLPIRPDMWRSTFGRFLGHETRAWKYLEAQSCTLTIRAEGLGTCALRFEHDPLPVRWLAHSRRGGVVVRLVDDCGQDAHPVVHFYSMAHPIEPRPLEPQGVRSYFAVTPPGGLCVAKLGLHTDAIVVSTPAAGMKDLQVRPLIPPLHRSAATLSKLWRLFRHWHGARRFGFLLDVRLRRVVDGLSSALFSSMCGNKWADAEVSFRRNPGPNTANALFMLVDKQNGFGVTLQNIGSVSTGVGPLSDQFLAAAASYGISSDQQLCDFALRLGHQPHAAVLDPDFDSLIARLLDHPAVLRGARLLALLPHASGTKTPPPSIRAVQRD